MKMSPLDRILLLLTGLLAAYQVAVGIDHFSTLSIIAYTIAFGVLIIASLLLIILGFEVLESPVVVIASTVIPLTRAGSGLAASGRLPDYLPGFAILGFLGIIVTRLIPFRNKLPTIVLALVHGVAGLTIFLLPLSLAFQGWMKPAFALVGVGGGLIGVGGLLLSFLKTGKPILSREWIFKLLPGLLFLMTVCYVFGFKYG